MRLIDFRIEVNVINLIYITKLGLKLQKIDISAQKINNSSLETYEIVIIIFQVFDKFDCL